MALLGFEGFDYQTIALLNATTNWQSISGSGSTFTAGLLGGRALFSNNTTQTYRYTPTAAGNYSTLIAGLRFIVNRVDVAAELVRFVDTSGTPTAQCGVSMNASGHLIFWRGTNATILATGATLLVANTWYYLEVKVKFASGTSGQFEVRIEGISTPAEMSNAATNTITTANAFANAIDLVFAPAGSTLAKDDLYLCDDTGSTANTFLLGGTGIRVETTFVTNSDTPLNFTPLNSFTTYQGTAITVNQPANTVFYFKWTPTFGGTVTSVIGRFVTSLVGKANYALYDNNGINQPGNLIATANEVTNPVGNAVFGSAPDIPWTFASPPTVVAGQTYWLALAVNAAAVPYGWNGVSGNYQQSQAYASGFPATTSGLSLLPTSSSTMNTPYLLITGSFMNAFEVQENSFDGDTSYNYSITNGDVDLFAHGALSNNPLLIHGVIVSAGYRKDDNTAQQFRTKLKSGATTVNGATRNVITTYQATNDMWVTDPNTGLAWTGTAVNASKIGYEHI